MWLRESLVGRRAARDVLLTAVTAMLSRSMAVMTRAQAMGLQMRLRSGLGESIDVATRLRKPADALELHDWMATDMAPLNEAWSVIWARGDQETVRLANALLAGNSQATPGRFWTLQLAVITPGTAAGELGCKANIKMSAP